MTTALIGLAAYRRQWLPELFVLVSGAVAAVLVFGLTGLDLAVARLFFDPRGGDHWPAAARWPWSALYHAAPWVTAALALAGVGAIVVGVSARRARRLSRYGLFLILSVALGPGVVVNGVLKDHWARPRPREVEAFGGQHRYVAPLLPGRERGKSFPCGHCSVGFLAGIGWWIWRRRRPRLAAVSLAGGLALGSLLGLGRMAAGAHFLSDVVWSALIALGVAHALYYYVLRLPAREAAAAAGPPIAIGRRRRALEIGAAALAGAAVVVGGLLASAHDLTIAERIPLASLPGRPVVLELTADALDLELALAGGPAADIRLDGHVHGFGLPSSDIKGGWAFAARPVPTLTYALTLRGWFTDVDGRARLVVPSSFMRVAVRIRRGDVRVVGTLAEAAAAGPPRPVLDLRTDAGTVTRLPAPPSDPSGAPAPTRAPG